MTFGNQWGGTILGAVTNSLFPSNNTTQQPSAQSFAANEADQWKNPFGVDQRILDALETAPDSQKSLLTTMAFMPVLDEYSKNIAARQKADAKELLADSFSRQQAGFRESVPYKLQLAGIQLAGQIATAPTNPMVGPGYLADNNHLLRHLDRA